MIILYCLLIISFSINASDPLLKLTENKKQQKIQKYEQELERVFNTLNTSINDLLTTNTEEKRIDFFRNTFSPAKKHFDDYFLNAPIFFCNPSINLVLKCFNKLLEPLQQLPENYLLPDTLLENISLKRDLLLETIQYAYKNADPSYYNKSHVSPNKTVVYSLRDSLHDLDKELQKLLQVQDNLLKDNTPYTTVCKNNLAWVYSKLFSYQTNTQEGPRNYAEPENTNNNPPAELVTQITNISDALKVLEKNLIHFKDVLPSELPGIGVIGQIKNLADTTKSFIESTEKNSYYVPAQTRESLVNTIKDLTVLCTPQFVEACQTKTLVNKLPATEENKKYIELIYEARLHETFKNNEQYLSQLKGILYTLGNNTYNTIVTNVTKTITTGIQNNIVTTPELKKTAAQKEEPASSGYFQLLLNPTEKATKLLDETKATGKQVVKKGAEELEKYAKETKHLTNLYNILGALSYLKAMNSIAKIHFEHIQQTPPTKDLPVQKINPFVKLYQPYAQENVLKKHSKSAKKDVVIIEEKSDQKNDIPLTNIQPVENSNVIHTQNEQPANNNSVPPLEVPVTTEDNKDNTLALVVPETKGPKSVFKTVTDWIGDRIPSDLLRYRNKFLPLITDLYHRNEKEHTNFKKLINEFQYDPIMHTLKTIDSFANLFNKDPEQQASIDEIIVLTLPHAVENYHKKRKIYDNVELKVLLTDQIFLQEWKDQLNQFENCYNDQIKNIVASLTTLDKLIATFYNLPNTDLKPLYEIVKVITHFIEEFIKALFNMNPNNRLKIVEDQKEAFLKNYNECKKAYSKMNTGIQTIRTCLDEALYPIVPLQEQVVA